ncbi:metallophosphoesterase [uncultured Tessaracoccus sp.]|uniref:metallophosphoesterase family protein n=1 Tax=uncultured Tessaracoccus sp. TaxID=905023 RepID=UPI00261DA33E|nr:metallophosphoesterase [uncultured Tessaracoccus sp.]
MKFIATGDWQLGMTAHYLDEQARPRYLEARFEAVRHIGALADEHGAEFVVVCGDVFESNQLDRRVLAQAFEAMRAIAVPLVLVPGNHDPLDASSIYNSQAFQQRCPSHVHVFRSSEPFAVCEGVEVVGAPWKSKRPLTDLLGEAIDGLEPPPDGMVRMLAGHGAASTLNPDPDEPSTFDVPRLAQALDDGLIHFVAVGDKHSTTQVADGIWYPGTPEVTSRREPDPGNVLLVDVQPGGATVETLHVGQWQFLVVEATLGSDADVEALTRRLESIEHKSRTAVWLRLSGTLTTVQHAKLETALDDLAHLFAKLSIWERHNDLAVIPDDADFSDLGLTGFADGALQELIQRASSDDEDDAGAAHDALSLLYRFAGGAR